MPKQKTHSGSKKRFDVTGSGKVKRAQSAKITRRAINPEREREFASDGFRQRNDGIEC
ncbi:MAG: 50S ribosomal protein L35 [Candidatus Borkfalkia sp.]